MSGDKLFAPFLADPLDSHFCLSFLKGVVCASLCVRARMYGCVCVPCMHSVPTETREHQILELEAVMICHKVAGSLTCPLGEQPVSS